MSREYFKTGVRLDYGSMKLVYRDASDISVRKDVLTFNNPIYVRYEYVDRNTTKVTAYLQYTEGHDVFDVETKTTTPAACTSTYDFENPQNSIG
jgi:hypothetical protein